MSNSEPEELTRAKELIEKNEYDDAFQILSDFDESEGNTTINKVSCHILQCQLLLWQGKYEDVINLGEQTYNESLGLGKNILSVDPLLLMAEAYSWLNQYNEMLDMLMQAEELINFFSEEISNNCLKRKAYLYYLSSFYYATTTDIDRAFEYAEKSLELRRKIGNELDIGFSLLRYSHALYLKSEIELGSEYINQAFELSKKCNNKYSIALTTRTLMLVYGQKGEVDLAVNYGEQSLELFRQIQNKPRIAALLSVMGDLYSIKGNFDKSIEYMEEALETNKQVKLISQNPLIVANLVQINIEIGNLEVAQQYFKNLEQLNNKINNEWSNFLYRSNKARLLKKSSRLKNLVAAAEIYEELIEEKTNFHNQILLDYCDLLLIELGMTNDVEIIDQIQFYLNEVMKSAERSQSFWVLAETCLIQAKVSLITLDLIKARRFLIQGRQIAEKQGYIQIAEKFAKEYEDLKSREKTWENFKVTDAPISERMKLARISEHLRQILRNRANLTTQITEDNLTIHKEQKICLVCRSEIKGYMYSCECNANYCESCAQALTKLENACWVCNAPMDQSKPIKPYKKDEEGIDLKILGKDQNEPKK